MDVDGNHMMLTLREDRQRVYWRIHGLFLSSIIIQMLIVNHVQR